jgi:hypothetical protein
VLGASVFFAPEGGLSWYTHLVVTGNTWADTLGTAGHLYERHAGYDKVTHLLGGVALTAAVSDVLRALDERGVTRLVLARRLLVAMLVMLVVNLGWELYEFLGDVAFHSERHHGRLDTGYDLIADVAGGLLSAFIIWIASGGSVAAHAAPTYAPSGVIATVERQQERGGA